MSMSNVSKVQEIYAAFGERKIAKILGFLEAKVKWDHSTAANGVPWLMPRTGPAEVGNFFETLSGIQFHKFQPLNFLTGGDQVVAIIQVELTVKKTGKKINDLEAHLWTFGMTGKVSEFKHLVDTWQHVQGLKAG